MPGIRTPNDRSEPTTATPREDRAGDRTAAAVLLPPIGWQAPALDFLALLARRRRSVAAALLVAFGCGMAGLLLTAPYYKASAVAALLAREKPNVDVAFRVGSVQTGMAGAQRDSVAGLTLPRQTGVYLATIRSRAVMSALATRFESALEDAYGSEPFEERLSRLDKLIAVRADDDTSLLTIEVRATNPNLAAELANAVVDEMIAASRGIERELMTRQARFLDTTVIRMEVQRKQAERALQEFQQKYGIVDLEAQASDVLRIVRELQMQKLSLQRQLIERRESWTDDDPHVQALQAQIAKCDDDIVSARQNYFGGVDESRIGELQQRFVSLRDHTRFQRDMVATLRGQRDVFRLRAEQPTGSVAVLRSATAPIRPAGPRRKVWLLSTLGIGILLAIGSALLLDQRDVVRADPYLARRADEIRGAFRGEPILRRLRVFARRADRGWQRRQRRVREGIGDWRNRKSNRS